MSTPASLPAPADPAPPAAEAGLEIRLNGAPHRIPRAMTLRELVESVGCDPQAVAVEVDGEIVRRAQLAATTVAAGATIEIVRFVQGG